MLPVGVLMAAAGGLAANGAARLDTTLTNEPDALKFRLERLVALCKLEQTGFLNFSFWPGHVAIPAVYIPSVRAGGPQRNEGAAGICDVIVALGSDGAVSHGWSANWDR